jgi:transposase
MISSSSSKARFVKLEPASRGPEGAMARARNGQAISDLRRRPSEIACLQQLRADAERAGDLQTWRRTQAVLEYIDGRRVVQVARELGMVRGTINHWLRRYELNGLNGLRPSHGRGAQPKLSRAQLDELAALVENGCACAQAAAGRAPSDAPPEGWTGRVVADLIWMRFGVRYHPRHMPRLLRHLGFSVTRVQDRVPSAARLRRTWLRAQPPEPR